MFYAHVADSFPFGSVQGFGRLRPPPGSAPRLERRLLIASATALGYHCRRPVIGSERTILATVFQINFGDAVTNYGNARALTGFVREAHHTIAVTLAPDDRGDNVASGKPGVRSSPPDA